MSDTQSAALDPASAKVSALLSHSENTGITSYGIITAQRILERFNIALNPHELVEAINNPANVYCQLLHGPMQNVFNGIILDQAIDYQVYAQKLYVDYLLSGEGNKDQDAPGADTREELEKNRLKLVAMGEEFASLQLDHKRLIAETQKYFKEHAGLIDPNNLLQIPPEIAQGFDKFHDLTHGMKDKICDFRQQFHDLILVITAHLECLPDYHLDAMQVQENKEALYFDDTLGI